MPPWVTTWRLSSLALQALYILSCSSYNMKLTIWIRIIVVLTIIAVGSACYSYHLRQKLKASCELNLQNYNMCIRSLGIHPNVYSIWESADDTQKSVKDTFGLDIPKCPSGGSYRLEYGRGSSPSIPKLVCSEEEKHNHGPVYDY